MSTETPVDILKRCYARWDETKGGCVDEWMDILADKIDFRSLAMGRPAAEFTGPRMSKEDVRGYFDGLCNGWAMDYYRIDHFVADGDMVCAVGSTAWTNKATGKKVDTQKVDFFRFKDGKVVSFFEYYDTAALIEAASGST